MSDLIFQFSTELLTPEQEHQLVKKKQFVELVMSAMHEATRYLGRCAKGRFSSGELVSICYESLSKQAPRFKPGKHRFFFYAKSGLVGSLAEATRKLDIVKGAGHALSIEDHAWIYRNVTPDPLGPLRRVVPLYRRHKTRSIRPEVPGVPGGCYKRKHPDLEDPEETSALEGIQPFDFHAILGKEQQQILDQTIERVCSEREQMILTLTYKNGYNFKEIGDLLGVSKSYIQSLHAKCIRKLRREISETIR